MIRGSLILLIGLMLFLAFAAAASAQQQRQEPRERELMQQPNQAMPDDYAQVLSTLNRKGNYADNVLRVMIPRDDLKVNIDSVVTPSAFGFDGWVALTRGEGGQDVVMGDLVLTEDEVNPVITALERNGLQVTSLHNHYYWENPRLSYLHIHGHGPALELALRLKPALDLIGSIPMRASGPRIASAALPFDPQPLDSTALQGIIGRQGTSMGQVYRVIVPRDDLRITDMGARINARMGLATVANFFGSDRDAMVSGDIAMLPQEVNPVVTELRRNGIDVVAIHNHMMGEQPEVIFLHFWGRGPAQNLATGFKSALDQLGRQAPETMEPLREGESSEERREGAPKEENKPYISLRQ